ncbi:Hypothetical predicted protein [Marmota monax]|uniref:MHC class II beta chain N-terminal domain-containing protein n=1 Tax=Marmota monax TaxID=9995 RepID=A0A5E4BR92_MARMO|nr:Hypothetical predicted protein [Marmota monax]
MVLQVSEASWATALMVSLMVLFNPVVQGMATPENYVFQARQDCYASHGTQRFVERYVYNRQELVRFDSDVGEFRAVTELGRRDAENFNSQKDFLEDERARVDTFCRHNYEIIERYTVQRREQPPPPPGREGDWPIPRLVRGEGEDPKCWTGSEEGGMEGSQPQDHQAEPLTSWGWEMETETPPLEDTLGDLSLSRLLCAVVRGSAPPVTPREISPSSGLRKIDDFPECPCLPKGHWVTLSRGSQLLSRTSHVTVRKGELDRFPCTGGHEERERGLQEQGRRVSGRLWALRPGGRPEGPGRVLASGLTRSRGASGRGSRDVAAAGLGPEGRDGDKGGGRSGRGAVGWRVSRAPGVAAPGLSAVLLPAENYVFQARQDCYASHGTQRFVERYVYNRQELVRFDSDVGEFRAVTELGRRDAENFNSQKDFLEDERARVDTFCRHNYEIIERYTVQRRGETKGGVGRRGAQSSHRRHQGGKGTVGLGECGRANPEACAGRGRGPKVLDGKRGRGNGGKPTPRSSGGATH